MSEGLWEEVGDLSEWEDAPVSEPGSDAWGAAPGTTEPLEAAQAAGTVEAAAEVTEAEVVEALAEEQAAETRERDEKGRFLPKQETQQEEAVEEAVQPERLYAGKLKSVEELERAYLELEQRSGRTSQELGELRALREEMAAIRERVEQPAPTPIPSNWDDVLDDNPAKAAKMALDAGDRERYEEAKAAWDAESPGAPEIYEQNMILQYELSQVKAKVEAQQQPVQSEREVNATAQALQKVKEAHPDWDKFEDAMAQVMEERPLYSSALREAVEAADADAQAAIFGDLYQLVAGRRSENLTQVTEEARRAAADAQLRARQDAVVVSATGNATEVKLSEADRIAAEWDKLDAPYSSGWLEP